MSDSQVYLPDWLTSLTPGAVQLLDQRLETEAGADRLLAIALRLEDTNALQLRLTPCTLSPHSLAFPAEISAAGNLLLLDFAWAPPVDQRFVLLLDPEQPAEREFLETLNAGQQDLTLVLVSSAAAYAQTFPRSALAGPLAETLSSASFLPDSAGPRRTRDPRWLHLARHFRGSEDALAWITDVPSLRLDFDAAAAASRLAAAPRTAVVRRLLEQPLVQ